MKSKILITLVLIFSCNLFSQVPKIIYGSDDRQEVQNTSTNIQQLATGVATNEKHSLFTELNNYLEFKHTDLTNYEICSDENFSKQTLLGDCSGFLVDKYLILTAGHCVPT